MKVNYRLFSLVAVLGAFALNLSAAAAGSELDEQASVSVPKAVLVKLDPKSQKMVAYRVENFNPSKVKTEAQLQEVISKNAVSSNVIAGVKEIDLAKSEFDQDSSSQAWWHCYYGNYWAANTYYWYSGYNYNWNYSYAWRGWSWNFLWR